MFKNFEERGRLFAKAVEEQRDAVGVAPLPVAAAVEPARHRPDFPLLAGCLALLGLGLVMVTSASSEVAAGAVGQPASRPSPDLPGDRPDFLRPDHDGPDGHLAARGWKLLLVAFGLLVLVITPGIGREVNGSMRWIGFGLFNIQPSEIAVCVVIAWPAT